MQFRARILSTGSDLYADNGFRITGQPIDASTQDLANTSRQLGLTAKLGIKTDRPAGPMPLSVAPSLHDIQEALAKLKDPHKRLVDDFFWFWPLPPQLNWTADPAIQALIAGEIRKALDFWGKAIADPSLRPTAIHNIAVMYHLVALERTKNPRYCEATLPVEQFSVSLWTQALLYWNQFFSTCSPVESVGKRIARIDDIRLSSNMAEEFSRSAELTIGMASATIAYESAEKEDWQRASFHIGILKKHFREPLLGEAIRLTVVPVRERLNEICLGAEADSKKEPAKGVAVVQKLLSDTKNDLLVLISFLDPGESLRDGAGDQIALCAMNALFAFSRVAKDWAACKRLFASAMLVAGTTTVKEKAKSNLATAALNELHEVSESCVATAETISQRASGIRVALLANVDSYKVEARTLLRWIEEQFGGSSKTYEEATAIYCAGVRELAIQLNNQAQAPDVALKLTLEALEVCKDKTLCATLDADLSQLRKNVAASGRRVEHPFKFSKPDRNLFDKHPAVSAILVIVGILLFIGWIGQYGHSSDAKSRYSPASNSSNYSRTLPPQPSSAPSNIYTESDLADAPPSPPFAPKSTHSNGLDLSALKASIENSNRILANLEKQVSLCNGQIDTEKRRLNVLKEDLDSLDDQQRQGLNIDTDYYNEIVDQYNSILVSYKALLSRQNALVKQHNTLLAYTNADIDKYNKAVRGY